MVQIPPTAREAPQVLVWAKGAAVVMVRGVRVAVPLLVSVTVCVALLAFSICEPKLRVVVERVTAGAPRPVPARGTTWVLDVPLLLSVTVSVP